MIAAVFAGKLLWGAVKRRMLSMESGAVQLRLCRTPPRHIAKCLGEFPVWESGPGRCTIGSLSERTSTVTLRPRIMEPCLLLMFLWAVTLVTSAQGVPDNRPNVLFLFADDQRPDTIAAYGNEFIQTPNLDRLASTGFNFRQNYCMGSTHGAVCQPSRAMLNSGRTR